MKIKDVKTFQLKVTVKEPFTSSRGWWYDTKGTLIVKIETLKAECKDAPVLDRISVGTVHTFQGSERDIIIWDLLEMRNFNIGRLYRGDEGDRLTNVAITRGRGKLILICDPEAFMSAQGYQSVRQIRSIISRSFRNTRMSWKVLEKNLGRA
jgi:hypothetical protein